MITLTIVATLLISIASTIFGLLAARNHERFVQHSGRQYSGLQGELELTQQENQRLKRRVRELEEASRKELATEKEILETANELTSIYKELHSSEW